MPLLYFNTISGYHTKEPQNNIELESRPTNELEPEPIHEPGLESSSESTLSLSSEPVSTVPPMESQVLNNKQTVDDLPQKNIPAKKYKIISCGRGDYVMFHYTIK